MSSYNLPYNITNRTNQTGIIIAILRFMTKDLPETVVDNCISYFINYLKHLSIGPWVYRISSQKKIKEIIEIKEDNDFCDYNICTSNVHPLNEVNTNIGFNSGPYVYQGSTFSAVVNKHNNNNTISLALCIIEKINNENTIKYMFSLMPKSNSLGNVYIHNFSKEKTQITKKFYIMPFTSSSNFCKGHNNIKQEIFDEYQKNGKKIIL